MPYSSYRCQTYYPTSVRHVNREEGDFGKIFSTCRWSGAPREWTCPERRPRVYCRGRERELEEKCHGQSFQLRSGRGAGSGAGGTRGAAPQEPSPEAAVVMILGRHFGGEGGGNGFVIGDGTLVVTCDHMGFEKSAPDVTEPPNWSRCSVPIWARPAKPGFSRAMKSWTWPCWKSRGRAILPSLRRTPIRSPRRGPAG